MKGKKLKATKMGKSFDMPTQNISGMPATSNRFVGGVSKGAHKKRKGQSKYK